MRVENQTSDPVEYEQTGTPPPPAIAAHTGVLKPGAHETFDPSGAAPFRVIFTAPPSSVKPDKVAEVGQINDEDATIVLVSFPIVFR